MGKVCLAINHYKRKIERHPSDGESLLHCLRKLSKLEGVTIATLQETGIGKVVNALKKHEEEEVAERAKVLVLKWKEIVAKEEQEEQRLLKEQIREEEKARKEYQRALAEAEREEKLYRELLLPFHLWRKIPTC